jgi:hypothetical protein
MAFTAKNAAEASMMDLPTGQLWAAIAATA